MRLRFILSVWAMAIAAMLVAPLPSKADDLLIDRGQQMQGLWLFPSLNNPKNWRYLPNEAVVSTDDEGRPLFSITFYVSEAVPESDPLSGETITQADGGGLLHFIVEYQTDPNLVSEAQDMLREAFDDDEIQITGPVVFSDGQYSVISSILNDEDARMPVMLAQSRAPVLEGNRVPISAQLTPELAATLLGSLKTRTPDLSVAFDMNFSGLSQAYDATMIVDWEKTSQSFDGGVGGSVYFVSVDVEAGIKRALNNGGITLEVNGEDSQMDALLQVVYDKALELMFAPVDVADVAEDVQSGLLDGLMSMVSSQDGPLSSRNTTGFGAYVSFKMKDIRTEGETRLSFNKRSNIERRTLLTVNVGDLYAEYGEEDGFVEFISTFDPAFAMRKIFVNVDGYLADDIGSFVNSVQVNLEKVHPGGRVTTGELVINPGDLDDVENVFGPLAYTNVEAEDARDWLEYQYRTTWSFKGGGTYQTDWVSTDAAMINLTAPYHRAEVFLEGDLQGLNSRGVRSIIAEVESDFFGEPTKMRRSLRPSQPDATDSLEPIALTLPRGEYGYDYKLTWIMNRPGDIRRSAGSDDLGFLFLDEIPEPAVDLAD